MSSAVGPKESILDRIANISIIIFSPLFFAFLILAGFVVLIETGAAFFSWRLVITLDKLAVKMGLRQAADSQTV